MLIKKIVKNKNSKYKLYLDNGEILVTYDDVILNHNLLFHKEINDELLEQINNENKYYELLYLSIKYISKRLRSEKEIRKYLENKTVDNYMIDNIIENLKSENYINDYQFTKAYINDKINLTNNGLLKIKHDLLELGIDEDIIEEETKKINFEVDNSKLEKLIIKKIRTNHKYSNEILRQRILNDFINLGYEKDDILNYFESNIQDDEDIYKNEYNKLYNKLKNKYCGSELDFQLKRRLAIKGFKKN